MPLSCALNLNGNREKSSVPDYRTNLSRNCKSLSHSKEPTNPVMTSRTAAAELVNSSVVERGGYRKGFSTQFSCVRDKKGLQKLVFEY